MILRHVLFVSVVQAWFAQRITGGSLLWHPFIVFVPPPQYQFGIDTILSSNETEVHWYGGCPALVRIIAMGRSKLNLILNCSVFPLRVEDNLNEMKFCFRYLDRSTTCVRTEDSRAEEHYKAVDLARHGGLKVRIYSSESWRQKGSWAYVSATTDESVDKLQFWCKAKNRHGILATNKVDFIDLRKNFPKHVSSRRLLSPINTTGGMQFRCQWTPDSEGSQHLVVKYQWHYCGSSVTDCRTEPLVMDLGRKHNWPAQVMNNGTLYWPYVPSPVSRILKQKDLVCFINDIPVVVYRNLSFTGDFSSPTVMGTFSLLQPKRFAEVKLFDSTQISTTLSCVFEAGPGAISVLWEYMDGRQPVTLRGWDEKRMVTVEGNRLTFLGPFTDETDGEYRCTVLWTPEKRRRPLNASGVYQVSTYGFPKVVKALSRPRVVEVFNGDEASVLCDFKSYNVFIPYLLVLGHRVDLSTKHGYERSLRTINNKYDSVMLPINATVDEIPLKASQTLSYTARGMAIRGGLNAAHYIHCVGQRGVYTVTEQVIIWVHRRPQIHLIPDNSHCIPCLPCERNQFTCEVGIGIDLNIHHLKARIEWLLVEKHGTVMRKANVNIRRWNYVGNNGTRGSTLKLSLIKNIKWSTVHCLMVMERNGLLVLQTKDVGAEVLINQTCSTMSSSAKILKSVQNVAISNTTLKISNEEILVSANAHPRLPFTNMKDVLNYMERNKRSIISKSWNSSIMQTQNDTEEETLSPVNDDTKPTSVKVLLKPLHVLMFWMGLVSIVAMFPMNYALLYGLYRQLKRSNISMDSQMGEF